VAGYYAQPNECIEALRAREILNLMGNHDHYLVTGSECPRSRSVNDCLAYQRRVITPANLEWLARSPLSASLGEINMVHAGWQDPLDEYILTPEESYFLGRPGRIFLSGHTHIPVVLNFAGGVYANPGSVGQPRDGDPRASFAVLEDGQVRIERVAYDIEATGRAMEVAGFNPYYYRNLSVGKRIGASIP
jgi:diadenosine tetraphosphatase ApaH/serine/threonine PP2A family protein phosphatase